MGALRLGSLALLLALAVPSQSRAQDAGAADAIAPEVDTTAPEVDTDPASEAAAGEATEADADGLGEADAEASSAEASSEELPAGADFGPALSERPPVLSPEEERRARERNFDPSEPEHPIIAQVYFGLGAALDSSLDGVLSSHRYGESPITILGDVSFLGRLNEWLSIGGRMGGRGRGWGSNDSAPAVAGGVDVLAVAHARAYLGKIVDIGAVLGAGIAWAGVSMQGGGAASVAPRLHASAVIAFRIESGLRLTARFAWDFYSVFDLDRYGSDLELGGPSLAVGFEVRR